MTPFPRTDDNAIAEIDKHIYIFIIAVTDDEGRTPHPLLG